MTNTVQPEDMYELDGENDVLFIALNDMLSRIKPGVWVQTDNGRVGSISHMFREKGRLEIWITDARYTFNQRAKLTEIIKIVPSNTLYEQVERTWQNIGGKNVYTYINPLQQTGLWPDEV